VGATAHRLEESCRESNRARRKRLAATTTPRAQGVPTPAWYDSLPLLDPVHLDKLRASGLTDETIVRMQCYTEYDSGRLGELLWNNAGQAPALVLPGFGADGQRNGHDIARFFPSVTLHDGRTAKYLSRSGILPRAYFPPLPGVAEAVHTPGALLAVTEGVLKAAAACQAGLPCIGLLGVWNWSAYRSQEDKDADRPRQLAEDLGAIDWHGKPVPVLFDSDRWRNPQVHRAACEFAVVLQRRGAVVRLLRLPLGRRIEHGPRAQRGTPAKVGLDDYLVRHGAAALLALVRDTLDGRKPQEISEFRRALCRQRRWLELYNGGYFDASPTGAGKSYADGYALRSSGVCTRRER
jgi:hypothetical protein